MELRCSEELMDKTSTSIYTAFRSIEEICKSANSLRECIEEKIKKIPRESGFEAREFSRDTFHTTTSSEWLTRETIDTFEIVRSHRKALLFHCAIQTTLAPDSNCSLETFTPHVAVLAAMSKHWGAWEAGEFILDDNFLNAKPDPNNNNYGWRKKEEYTWIEPSTPEPHTFLAFVVPLVEFKSEKDVETKLINVFLNELKIMLADSTAKCNA